MRAPGFRVMQSARIPMRSARPCLQIPPRGPTNHVFSRLEHTSTSAEAIERLAERMHLAEVSLGNSRFVGKGVFWGGLLVGIFYANHYGKLVRKVDLLYATMEPQVEETERLRKIEEAQKTIDECGRVQQEAQKTIDAWRKRCNSS